MVEIKWGHLTVYPETFKEFRQLRNMRMEGLTDNAFIELLLKMYKQMHKDRLNGL